MCGRIGSRAWPMIARRLWQGQQRLVFFSLEKACVISIVAFLQRGGHDTLFLSAKGEAV